MSRKPAKKAGEDKTGYGQETGLGYVLESAAALVDNLKLHIWRALVPVNESSME